MNKQNLYKGLKIFFYLAGFPLMLTMMLITLAPMFGVEVMGGHAGNWIIIFFAIWAAVEIIHLVLKKFIGSKSENGRRIALVVTAVVAVLAIILPITIYNAVMQPKFDSARAEISSPADVKSYASVTGWHRDFTTRYKGESYYLINEHYDFMKMYGLQHTYSEYYSNADKENGLGYKYGSIEMAQKLVDDKRAAKAALAVAQEELSKVEADYQTLKDAYAADPSQENLTALNNATPAYETAILRLKGARVDISFIKPDLAALINKVVAELDNGVVGDGKLLPDGLVIEINGFTMDVGWILDLVLSQVDLGSLTGGLADIIPDVIYTGIGDGTITTYQNMVDGSDSDLSLAQAEAFNFKISHYPAALAAGAVKYAAYICVGLVLMSLILTEYFSQKEREAKGGETDEK